MTHIKQFSDPKNKSAIIQQSAVSQYNDWAKNKDDKKKNGNKVISTTKITYEVSDHLTHIFVEYKVSTPW